MSMYTRAMLNAWLKDIILVNHHGTKELASDGGIVLLTSPDAALSSEYLYIGTSDIVTQILESMTHSAEYEQKTVRSHQSGNSSGSRYLPHFCRSLQCSRRHLHS